MNLAVALRILPTLILSACCCCDIGWLIPDDVGDAMTEAVTEKIIEEGVGLATGGDLDIQDGRIAVTGPDGERMVLEEGDSVSSKLPITPHPGCPISGSMSASDAETDILSAGQTECEVSIGEMTTYYQEQLKALGGTYSELVSADGATLRVVDQQPSVQVSIGPEDGGKSSVLILVGKQLK